MSLPFSRDIYSVRPRAGLLGLMFRSYAIHDIRSVPPGEHYAFSRQTGELRNELDGVAIAHLKDGERTSLLGPRVHTVGDPANGLDLGALVRRGRDWEIRGAAGDLLTVVRFVRASSLFGSFVAHIGDDESAASRGARRAGPHSVRSCWWSFGRRSGPALIDGCS